MAHSIKEAETTPTAPPAPPLDARPRTFDDFKTWDSGWRWQ
jgi:hypothetical protein